MIDKVYGDQSQKNISALKKLKLSSSNQTFSQSKDLTNNNNSILQSLILPSESEMRVDKFITTAGIKKPIEDDKADTSGQIRLDAFGNEIKKGSKKGRISFIDTVHSKHLIEFVDIKSVKNSVYKNSYSPYKSNECQCDIF